jgi:hypothetical protein
MDSLVPHQPIESDPSDYHHRTYFNCRPTLQWARPKRRLACRRGKWPSGQSSGTGIPALSLGFGTRLSPWFCACEDSSVPAGHGWSLSSGVLDEGTLTSAAASPARNHNAHGERIPRQEGGPREILSGSRRPIPTNLRDHPKSIAAADLTVLQVADRYGRHASTVRLWLERGAFPGAYKLRGRDWRVPPHALEAFENKERERGRSGERPGPRVAAKSVDLSDWRRAS